MKCPFCEQHDSFVVDSRWAETKGVTRRRYECRDCGERFSTHETYNKATRKQMITMVAQKLAQNDWR